MKLSSVQIYLFKIENLTFKINVISEVVRIAFSFKIGGPEKGRFSLKKEGW